MSRQFFGARISAPQQRRERIACPRAVNASWFARLFACTVCFWPLAPALAHNPDTSYARVRISADKLELRFTYDLFTLLRMSRFEDGGGRLITRAELKRRAPAVFEFLRKHITLEVNESETSLGEAGVFGWANDSGDAIAAQDFHSAAALVHFTFIKPLDDLPQDVALTFGFFEDLGARHTVQGVFELNGQSHEISFTRFEPDYLFDTGYQPTAGRRAVVFLKRGGWIIAVVVAGLLWTVARWRRMKERPA